MTAAAQVAWEWLGWNPRQGAGRARRPLCLGLVLLGGLAVFGLAGTNDGPTSIAAPPPAWQAAGVPLPLRVALSRAVGADAPDYAAVGTPTGAMMRNALQGLD